MKGNITCSCGHSWSKSDSSKKDASVCHICGKDNTMKDGGWLDKYQEGGNVAVSDATRTKFTKNTGLKKGVDQPVSNMLDITLSAPQRQLVKMITGKEQSPSEAMGIENPYGAFAADAILDPTNLVGAGLLGKAAKASTKTGILSKAYKLNPWAFKPTPEAYYRMLGEEGVTDALTQGKLRPAQNSNNWTMSTVKNRADKVWFNKGNPMTTEYDPNLVLGYKGPGMAEYSGKLIESPGGGSHLWDRTYGYAENNIPLSDPNVKLLKEHWLQGYKEVPKKENGGWLDKYNDGGPIQPNYNDSNASAGPGFEGDGYSNVGRNYSPAWGGQFKDGGPIYTTNPKDPRLQAYKDSSILYNNYVKQYSAKGENRPLTKEEIKIAIKQRENPRANYPNTKVLNVKGSNKVKKYHYSDSSGAYNAELVDDMFHPVIKPIGSYLYQDYNFWNTNINNIYKKPTQPITYKPEPTPQSTIDFMEGNYAQEPVIETPQPQASAYGEVVDPRTGYTHMTRQGSPMYPMVGQNVPEMEEGGPVKRFMQPTETFKNFGYNPKEKGLSTEYSTSIGGPGEVYLVPGYRQGRLLDDPEATFNMYGEHLGGPFKTVQAAEDFAQLRHKYVEQNKNLPAPFKTRDYAMGGSIPGAVGFTYARTGSIPSNGKYAKKTKASAQNGTEMEYYQNGLDWKPRSMAKGGEVVPGENEELQIPSAWDDEKVFIKNNPRLRGSTPGSVPRFMPPQMLDLDQFEVEDVNYDQAALKHFVNSLTPAESKNYIPKMEDKFDTMENMYNTKSTKFDEDWSKLNSLDKSSNKIKLNTGRFRGAKVPTNIIDELAETSRKQNVPLGQLLTLMGRESMFGSGAEANQGRASNKTDLMSGWNIAEDYQPYEHLRFLADNKVPGIKTNPTPHGYDYDITDDRAMNNYLRKNPKILEQYQQKLDSAKSLGGQDAFDLTAKFLKKKGVKGYNPNDPNYTNLFNQDYNLLKQDKNLMKYVKQKGYTFEDGGSLELTKLDQLTNFTNYNPKQPGGWLDKYES